MAYLACAASSFSSCGGGGGGSSLVGKASLDLERDARPLDSPSPFLEAEGASAFLSALVTACANSCAMAGAVTDAEEEEADDDETAEGGACGGLDRPRPADGAASPPPEPPSAMALASKPYWNVGAGGRGGVSEAGGRRRAAK